MGKGEVKGGTNEEGFKNGKREMVNDGKRGRVKGGLNGKG
jgi:hypothetical protein